MGPKRKKHTNKTTAQAATCSNAGSIFMENVANSQAIFAAGGTETATTTASTISKKNRDRHHHHQHTSRSTNTNGSHHPNSRKRSLRQRQQSSLSSSPAAVKNSNNNSNSNRIIEDDDIEDQLKRQRQKQADKIKQKDVVADPNKSVTVNADTDDAAPGDIGAAADTAATLPPKNLGMYRYDPKRQAYFPATSFYEFSSLDAEDDDDDGDMMRSSRHHHHPPVETSSSSVVVARNRTFPHTPLLDKKLLAISSSSSSSLSSCSFAYPVASCGNLSQRLGLVSTWAGRAVLDSFGWTPSAAFLPSSLGSHLCTWQFLHGCTTMNSNTYRQTSSSNNGIIVRPVDIDCKIGTVSWTRTFDIQWPTYNNNNNNNNHNNGSDSFRQQHPRVVTVTDRDYVVQQHGKSQGRHLDFRRHCLGASVHSPRFLDTVHFGGNTNSSTPSLLGTLDSAHGRSSLRLHKLCNNYDDDEDDDYNNHADVVFNFSSTQNDFVYCANDSLVFAPVMHHHHAANTNQQSHHRRHQESNNVNVNNINNGYAPWLLCIEHGSFGAIRNEANNSEGLFPNSEALCVEADPSNPNCCYFGHRNGQVTLFDINSGGQSTKQESLPSSAMATTTTNRRSLPFFGSITNIHPLSSSLSPRQVLVRGSQGSCRLYDFRKLGGSRSSGTNQGKRHGQNHGDPSLVFEMTPLPLLEDNKDYYDDYAFGNNNLNNNSDGEDGGGGNSHVQRRHRRRQVQRLTNRCNGVVTNPEETLVILPHVQVHGADQEEMPTLGFWSIHTGDWIGSKPLTGNNNKHHEQFPATAAWGVSWIELSKRITPAWQWRGNHKNDDNDNDNDNDDNNERDRENAASNLRPRPGSFGLWYKCGQSMAGPNLPPTAGSIHHVYATGNLYR